ncbi:MAG: hypothetical protein H6714_02350 [Myxococcales bacterium]|nr:hypothetical protein [Myxococcales bacterium]
MIQKQKILAFCALFALACSCATGRPDSSSELLATLRKNMARPVGSPQALRDQNHLVKKVVEEDVFGDMRRHEVAAAIGRGSPCREHPDCMNRGFEGDDWVYVVGQQSHEKVLPLPLLMIGFDREGHHVRSHYVIRE